MAEKKTSEKKTRSRGVRVPDKGPLAQIFGVRHLSPGAALHLSRFIEKVDPTAILIEGPSDATELLGHLVHKKTRPPVALLAYTRQRPVRSILYPLAAYSPEWVALTMGLRAGKLVRFMDLPAATFLAMHGRDDGDGKAEAEAEGAGDAAPDAPGEGAGEARAPAASDETRAYLDDPWEEIARISGDPDHETWWERHFEHTSEEGAYRDAILEFGAGLRTVRNDPPARERETLTREAYMRKVIGDTIAEGHDPARIVVVCGAYHAPVLIGELPAMTAAEAKKLARVDTSLTLMPYSYYRLSAQSGYGAGNHAPGYFQMLWEERVADRGARLTTRFMAELAGRMRAAGTVRSSAEVIEAVRLAEAVAAVAGSSAPTLRDLRDAAATCLNGGDAAGLARHLHDVEVGDAIGALPPGVARTALQDDFHHLVKALRLDEYLKDREQEVKGHTGKPWLDRRLNRFTKTEDAAARDRHRSVFFHRLEVLGVPFAQNATTDADREESTYKERWKARWTPECEISLAENALRGDTVAAAAAAALREQLAAAGDVGAAARLARVAVDCDLEEAVRAAIARVQALAVDDAGFVSVAAATRELATLARYRDVTDVDVRPLEPLVAQLFLRATLLAHAATRCADDAARAVGRALEHVHHVAFLGDDAAERLAVDRWVTALDEVAGDDTTNAFVSGVACALLLERALVSDEVLEQRVAQRLSPGMDAARGAGYFEGLASRNHMALLSRKRLWAAMTDFIEALDDAAFRKAVVGLRRAFAGFEDGEVRRVCSLLVEVWGGGGAALAQAVEARVDDAELATLQAELGDLGDLDL